jgi:four helix bundle protein
LKNRKTKETEWKRVKIERFEDIVAWKKARAFSGKIYPMTQTGAFARDFGLREQICRAAVSIASNIAEGYERDGNKEFYQFLSIAKGSCGEVRSHLYIAYDQKYISKPQFELLSGEAIEISRIISGFMEYLKKSSLKGIKFNR